MTKMESMTTAMVRQTFALMLLPRRLMFIVFLLQEPRRTIF
jgi:hypothetical protein